MKIDPDLEKQYQRDPGKTIDAIIVCSEYSDALRAELESAGFHITSLEQAEFGLIYGSMRLADLPAFKKLSGIESIEPDSPQYAL
jgi:hypothetical protein